MLPVNGTVTHPAAVSQTPAPCPAIPCCACCLKLLELNDL